MYTSVKSVQILISLLKQHNIKHFVNSPGTRNTPLVHSIENDPFFKCYSIVDERSAAYFALGISEALDVPVCVTCTAATATCNYMPAIKEAYERNIQLVALTADRDLYTMFNMQDQSINQVDMYNGYVKYSATIPAVSNDEDAWYVNRKINEALLEINHHGKGPIQINYRMPELGGFYVKEIPKERKIQRLDNNIDWKEVAKKLSNKKRILIFAGSNYSENNEKLKKYIKQFNQKYNSVVFIDHYSNITDEEFIYSTIVSESITKEEINKMLPDLIISFGNIIYSPIKFQFNGRKQNFEHWHIAEDGIVNDGFRALSTIFECNPLEFFENTINVNSTSNMEFYKMWKDKIDSTKYPEMKFTNFTAIRDLVNRIPQNSVVHASVLDSIRISNYYKFNKPVISFANIGADGIDGALSTFLGQAENTQELAFLIIGDLSYLYDMNATLNIKNKNIRIAVINNFAGAEFHKNFGLKMIPSLNVHIAAGHNTKISACSKMMENLEYLSASNEEELQEKLEKFTKPNNKPMILEIFTDAYTDAENLKNFWEVNKKLTFKGKTKKVIKKIVGEKGKATLKKFLKRG